MRRLLILLVAVSSLAEAQTYLQLRRGNASVRPTGLIGEPLWDRDSLDLWFGSDSGNVLVGGRSVVYGKAVFAKDAGSTDAYAITLVPTLPNYYNGLTVRFRANTANTGTATLNVNSLGAKTIYKGPAASDTLTTGDITAGEVVECVYADSAFYVQGTTQGYADPALNFKQVPSDALGLVTSSWGTALNDSITVCAVWLNKSLTLGSAWVASGALTGSPPTRTYSVAVYSSDKVRLDTTSATAWPGDGTGGEAAFHVGATVGPGLVYVCWSTNLTSGSFTFRSPDMSLNSLANGMIAGQNSTYPIIGYATVKLSSGAGWPSTITISKSTTTTLFPYIMLAGSSMD